MPDIRKTAELVSEISAACREQDIGAAQAEDLQASIAFFRVDRSEGGKAQASPDPSAKARPKARLAAKATVKPLAFKAGQTVARQQARLHGLTLDMSMGGPDPDDSDFKASA